jgi:hypothetical protein
MPRCHRPPEPSGPVRRAHVSILPEAVAAGPVRRSVGSGRPASTTHRSPYSHAARPRASRRTPTRPAPRRRPPRIARPPARRKPIAGSRAPGPTPLNARVEPQATQIVHGIAGAATADRPSAPPIAKWPCEIPGGRGSVRAGWRLGSPGGSPSHSRAKAFRPDFSTQSTPRTQRGSHSKWSRWW